MSYETVWSGSTWRQYPAPVLAVTAAPVTRPTMPATVLLLSLLTPNWQSRRALKDRAEQQGIPRDRVSDYLSRLVEDGRAEYRRVVQPRRDVTDRPHTYHFYRRAQ